MISWFSRQSPILFTYIDIHLTYSIVYVWSHPDHYPIHPSTQPSSHRSHYHGHEWITPVLVKLWPWKSRSMSWVSAKYLINLLPFNFTSIRPTIPEIQLFWNSTMKNPRSRSWVTGLVGMDLFNDDTRPSGHICRPTQVNVSQSWFHSLNNYSNLIILYTSGS